ncbi:TetR family transcriptional regulator [Virgibacillus halodenitrificans]|uniref:TetR family transcriptional regulator n=1 Tax=Virgibacillus halodenitrificans TaxID=1482 RepID=A0ABR7VP86_VIRHA|nr:TetR family transcriptional regulator [Virgibacillus halodenitrificans]MBD1223556.1 TetR family transcriptional regulator [Virgibacillus halodenitrificans]
MDDKKEKIIRSAIEVFKEKGIEKAKVSEIVKGAGIAQGTFYLYFSSKLAVMPSIAEKMVGKTMEAIEREIKEETPFDQKLEQIIELVFEITKEYKEIMALIYAGLASSDYLAQWETIYQPYYKWMSNFLENAKLEGEIREDIDPKHTAELIIGLIESVAEQSYLYDNQETSIIERKKEEVFSFIKHGLKK